MGSFGETDYFFYEFAGMIKCLLIGNKADTELYEGLIKNIKYFNKPELIIIDNLLPENIDQIINQHDAVLLVSPVSQLRYFFERAIKSNTNLYYTDQPSLSIGDLTYLLTLQSEANNLLYPEVIELKHPLVQDFINSNSHHLLFRYNKTFFTRNQIRSTLLNALGFVTILSPMQVKKIDINSIEATNNGRPAFRIKLKMYDSSIGYIFLKQGRNNEHNIIIESKLGNFVFNMADCYLENIHGIRFNCENISDEDLITKSLEEFAICIILNSKPHFQFYHYTLVAHLLFKIENMIENNF